MNSLNRLSGTGLSVLPGVPLWPGGPGHHQAYTPGGRQGGAGSGAADTLHRPPLHLRSYTPSLGAGSGAADTIHRPPLHLRSYTPSLGAGGGAADTLHRPPLHTRYI